MNIRKTFENFAAFLFQFSDESYLILQLIIEEAHIEFYDKNLKETMKKDLKLTTFSILLKHASKTTRHNT